MSDTLTCDAELDASGLNCPLPLPRKDGALLGALSGRPAALISFLEGMWLRKPAARHCREVGRSQSARSFIFERRGRTGIYRGRVRQAHQRRHRSCSNRLS